MPVWTVKFRLSPTVACISNCKKTWTKHFTGRGTYGTA